jgi:hypothetical protein
MVTSSASAKRVYSALTAKDWGQSGVDLELAIQRVEEMCEITGLQLRLADAFGVRMQEFIMFTGPPVTQDSWLSGGSGWNQGRSAALRADRNG